MDSSERPHRTSSNSSGSSELFICFTSRLSSSSMKLSSKSILSPGRARESSQISLSSSLSRRLRSNGSMKGGQASPMFPAGGKKRGCAFENPEPSSPKVTCIGQVRVKTKKQGKKMRSRSRKRGEVSFRRVEQNSNVEAPNQQDRNLGNFHNDIQFQNHHQQQECLPHRNQRWVHLPLTICEALRAFGAEFNCFLPCRSSCTTREQKEEKAEGASGANGSSSCGAVFARWLVAVQEGEGKGREIELVVGEEERVLERRSSQRRDVFEGIEFKEEKCERSNEVVEEEEAKVSVCVPPKNALLLMRCRSDPLKMAALANRFWESPAPQDEDGENNKDEADEENANEDLRVDEEQEDVEEGKVSRKAELGTEHKEEEMCEEWVPVEVIEEHEIPEAEAEVVLVEVQENEGQEQESPEDDPEIKELQEGNQEKQEQEEELEGNQSLSEEETVPSGSSAEVLVDSEEPANEEKLAMAKLLQENEDLPMLLQHNEGDENEDEAEHHEEEEKEDEERRTSIHSSSVLSVHFEPESEEEPEVIAEAAESSPEEKETTEKSWEDDEESTVTHSRSEPEHPVARECYPGPKSKERETPVLPDCLLLMMCEPKLSMEVSKETWVCSTDFIRWLPEKHVEKVIKIDGADKAKKRIIKESNPAAHAKHPPHQLHQPPRSSCSFPSAAASGVGSSMATMIEQKLGNAVAYEPFVLTRCKSEPMRSASKLAPEACFWKSRKLEPHKPATLGVGAAGVGF